jgi:hypothetical protein
MNRKKIATVLAVAALAVAGNSAYTAAITNSATGSYLGAVSQTVTGGTINTINFAPDATATYVSTITVTFNENDLSTAHLFVTPTGGTASLTIDCGKSAVVLTHSVFTCDTTPTPANWPIAGLTSVAYVVAPGL